MTTGSSPNAGGGGRRQLERSLELLHTLAARPQGMSLTELAAAARLPASTTHRLLTLLREHQLVRETPDGRNALGPGTIVLAGAFLDGLDLPAEARPIMRRVVDTTGETCHLGVLAIPHIVYIEKVDSPQRVRMVSHVGGTNPALTTALGRAILAYAPETETDMTLQASAAIPGLEVDREGLAKVLAEVRELGFSTDLELNEPGICCLGAPIFDHVGRPIAAISVSTPAGRFDHSRLTESGEGIRAAADEITKTLGGSAPGELPYLTAFGVSGRI